MRSWNYARVKMEDRFPEQAEIDLTYLVDQKNDDRMIKQLLNSVIAKYRDLSVSHRSIICLSLQHIIELLAPDKSRYFAQPRCNCWMKIILVEVEQIFLLGENDFGWSWKKMRIVEYKYKMLNIKRSRLT